jgi:hypothetical protein
VYIERAASHDLLLVLLLSPRGLLLCGARLLSRLSAEGFTDTRRQVASTGRVAMPDFSYWRDMAGEYLRLAEVCKDRPAMALMWTELADAHFRAISELQAKKTSAHHRRSGL